MQPASTANIFKGKLVFAKIFFFTFCFLICISNCETKKEKWKQSKFYPLLMRREIKLPFYQKPVDRHRRSPIKAPAPIYLATYPRIATGSGSMGNRPPVWPSFPSPPTWESNHAKNKSGSGSGSGSRLEPPATDYMSEEEQDYPSMPGAGDKNNKLPSASAGGDNKPSKTPGEGASAPSRGNHANSTKPSGPTKIPIPPASGNSTSKGPISGSMPGHNKTESPKKSPSPSSTLLPSSGGSGNGSGSGAHPGGEKDNDCSTSESQESYDQDDCLSTSSAEGSSSLPSSSGKGNSTSTNKQRPPTDQPSSMPSNASEATTSKPTTTITEASSSSDAVIGGMGNSTKSCTSTNVGNHKVNVDYNWKIVGFFDYARDSEKYGYPFTFKLENLALKPDELPGSWYISLTQEPVQTSADTSSVWSLNVTYQTAESAKMYIEVSVTAKVGIKTYSYNPMNANQTFNENDTKEEANSKSNNAQAQAPTPTFHNYVAFWEDIKLDRHKESIVTSLSKSQDTLELVFHVEALTIPKNLNSTDRNC